MTKIVSCGFQNTHRLTISRAIQRPSGDHELPPDIPAAAAPIESKIPNTASSSRPYAPVAASDAPPRTAEPAPAACAVAIKAKAAIPAPISPCAMRSNRTRALHIRSPYVGSPEPGAVAWLALSSALPGSQLRCLRGTSRSRSAHWHHRRQACESRGCRP